MRIQHLLVGEKMQDKIGTHAPAFLYIEGATLLVKAVVAARDESCQLTHARLRQRRSLEEVSNFVFCAPRHILQKQIGRLFDVELAARAVDKIVDKRSRVRVRR